MWNSNFSPYPGIGKLVFPIWKVGSLEGDRGIIGIRASLNTIIFFFIDK